MSKGGSLFMERFLLVVCMLVTAECSNSSSVHYVMPTDSTLIYYDMSTEYITLAASTSVLSGTPSPTPNVVDVEEMERNAVVMTFNDVDLQQWVQIENTFLSIIAAESTVQCASSEVDCRTMNNVTYTSEDVKVLDGYPRMVEDRLLVVFIVALPSEAIPSDDDGSLISQDTLLSIAAAATAAVTAQTGVEVDEISRYTVPVSTAAAQSSQSNSNLVIILPLTIIPAVILISVAVGLGSLYTWKLIKKHRRTLDLSNKSIRNEKVELMSYKATL